MTALIAPFPAAGCPPDQAMAQEIPDDLKIMMPRFPHRLFSKLAKPGRNVSGGTVLFYAT